jgi:hypothetical protein
MPQILRERDMSMSNMINNTRLSGMTNIRYPSPASDMTARKGGSAPEEIMEEQPSGERHAGQTGSGRKVSDTAETTSSIYRDQSGNPLTREEVAQLRELQSRDREVRQHEMAHVAAGGSYISSGAVYSYRRGPDGKRYAVAGEVGIDTSRESTPEATIAKMRVVKRAALAPAHPSAQDRAVAARASLVTAEAQAELVGAYLDKRV